MVKILKKGKGEISYKEIWDFVNNEAKGDLSKVTVQPLANVNLKDAKKVPFGYSGKVDGTRIKIQNWILTGVDGNMSLKAILNQSAKLGHSKKRPICIQAMLNGGYSSSSSTWGTGYIQLVVK